MDAEKLRVRDFWNAGSCGEVLYLKANDPAGYAEEMRHRYVLEPYIPEFARFSEARGLRVLEIGVGMGADHQCFAEAGAELWGIDLTERAVEHCKRRLSALGLKSRLGVGDAEALDFDDNMFDLVYSWGVLHHSPDTPRAIAEVHRVLKPGACARIMIYHKWSAVGLMLWVRYALMAFRPWTNISEIYSRFLESPGTKAYSKNEALRLFSAFKNVRIEIVLSHGDLLDSEAGQRHRGPLLAVARKLWPRGFIRRHCSGAGLFMLISAEK
jgi:ubiquinone/menaquinone biosynthesis C-methylase UbiE